MLGNQRSMTRTVIAILLLVAFARVAPEFTGGGSKVQSKPTVTSTSTSVAEGSKTSSENSVTKDADAAETKSASNVETSEVSARTESFPTGDFDFYVLSLSWSPTHCASDVAGGRENDLQCRSGRAFGFVLHGLWPQHNRGYPEFCASEEPRNVSADIVKDVLKLSPSEKLIQHEWVKHGTCSGLTQDDYFAAAALAVESVRVPKAYKQPQSAMVTTANDVRKAFLDANPALSNQSILVTCRRNEIAEVRVCLDKELRPQACSKDTLKSHCGGRDARMLAVRGNWPRN